jgi:hypothetical protein
LGQVAIMRSKFGVCAKAGAFAPVSSRLPQPSKIHNTTGFGVMFSCQFNLLSF